MSWGMKVMPARSLTSVAKIESEQDKKGCPSLLGSTTTIRHRDLRNSWFRTKQEVITRQERTAREQFHASVEILTLDLLHY